MSKRLSKENIPRDCGSSLAAADFTALTPEGLDQFAWEAIVNWPAAAGFSESLDGINVSEITRFFLWDKVGRAIRARLDPQRAAFEIQLQAKTPDANGRENGFGPSLRNRCAGLTHSATNAAYNLLRRIQIMGAGMLDASPSLYVPVTSTLLNRTTEHLTGLDRLRVLAPRTTLSGYAKTLRSPRPPRPYVAKAAFAKQVAASMIDGLRAQGIDLLPDDIPVLERQLLEQTARLQSLQARVNVCRPDAILLFADNHPPFQEYTFIAQRRGIATIVLQHGLDCESFYLDDAFAEHIAVWGHERLERYLRFSNRQPSEIRVTGNPEYDHLRLPRSIDDKGSYWLWLTRPHAPEKCFSPSRWPDEGVEILDALLAALALFPSARLVIKPHPSDYVKPYQDRIEQCRFPDRVSIDFTPAQELIPSASIIITEDSTAGLEAMFWGKIVIHAHFSTVAPVIGFVRDGAALSGFSKAALIDAIERAFRLSTQEKAQMLEAQRKLVSDLAGSCDGRAAQRVTDFIVEIINSSRHCSLDRSRL